ncbi:MAG: hypothetical protein AAF702_15495 [Chloroflexota bacterium]
MLPAYWYLMMAVLSLMLPAGLLLVSIAGLDPTRAWDAAVGSLAASGLSGFLYWAVGFGLHFGGVGLVYTYPALQTLIWEWSALSTNWGSGWGMAGLNGWFLSGVDSTPLIYSLFLAHLPWVMTASMIPVIGLRGRAPAMATLLIAACVGGVIYPIAGNWVQGGGWLSALGRNLQLGHGLLDYAGTGTVFLTAGGFAFAALLLWVPRQSPQPLEYEMLPAAHLPLLGVVGSLFVLMGSIGWLGANPLQVTLLDEMGLMRGAVNVMLAAGGGVLLPLLYTWFVTGQGDPLMGGRGFAAGAIAILAASPFVQPGSAFLIGLIAGSLLPFVTYICNSILQLDDVTGILHMVIIPAMVGLLFAGILADGRAGIGWQMIGLDTYLGVPQQGVSGLFVADGYQADFPGQLQAQVIGLLALVLWGFLPGLLICTPISLLFYAVESLPSSHKRVIPTDEPQQSQEVPLHSEDLSIPQALPSESTNYPQPKPRFTTLTRRRQPREPLNE